MKYIFLGGAGEVGASCLLIQVAGRNLLMDCGIRVNRWGDAASPDFKRLQRLAPRLDAIFISHAHADHIGALPELHEMYPTTPTFMTRPTAELAAVMLSSALHVNLMAPEAARINPIRERAPFEDRGVETLFLEKRSQAFLADMYTKILASLAHSTPTPTDTWIDLGWGDTWGFRFIPSGHILGAVSIELRTPEGRFLYTGDVSAFNQKIVDGIKNNLSGINPDFMWCESTYGNANHPARKTEERRLAEAVTTIIREGGKVLIPSFALGRAQEIIMILLSYMESGLIPEFPILTDGLVNKICEVYEANLRFTSQRFQQWARRAPNLFYTPPIRPVQEAEREHFLRLNRPYCVIASSGMLVGGASFERRWRKDREIAIDFFSNAFEAVESSNGGANRFGFAVKTPALVPDGLAATLSEYADACKQLSEDFGVDVYVPEEAPLDVSLSILFKSAVEIGSRLKSVTRQEDPHLWCYWSEVLPTTTVKEYPYRLSLKRTPIDISSQIAPLYKAETAVIFTSATLQVAGRFSRIREQLGLNENALRSDTDENETPRKSVIEKVYPSPFPYRKTVEIHLFGNTIQDRPYDLEAQADYMRQQALLVEYYIRRRDGRALVLCASQKFLFELYESLEGVCSEMGSTPLLQLGTDRLKQTFNDFKADERSVLFGVASCWEGLDAPGSTLETVIIPQLPFAPPHPLLDARRALLANPDEDWFREISLPDMLLHLKQGAGRLVRTTTDCGVIAILSPRPLTKPYGWQILKALPPGRLVKNHVDALKFLSQKCGTDGN